MLEKVIRINVIKVFMNQHNQEYFHQLKKNKQIIKKIMNCWKRILLKSHRYLRNKNKIYKNWMKKLSNYKLKLNK